MVVEEASMEPRPRGRGRRARAPQRYRGRIASMEPRPRGRGRRGARAVAVTHVLASMESRPRGRGRPPGQSLRDEAPQLQWSPDLAVGEGKPGACDRWTRNGLQ